jgi:hypothetical protein
MPRNSAEKDATERIVDNFGRGLEEQTRKHMREPFATLDTNGGVIEREGMNAGRRILSAALSINPRNRRSRELAGFDEKVAALSARLGEANARILDLQSQRQGAPERDTERLAQWHLEGARGQRPEPEAGTFEQAIRDAEADRDGLQRAVDQVLDEKAAWVERHREKLVSDAAGETATARLEYEQAIEALEAARATLIDARLTELWALTFPSEVASRQPLRMQSLARALTGRLERAGVGKFAIDAPVMGRLLREDAEALAVAIDPEQKALLAGTDARAGGALWEDSDQGQDLKQRAMREAAQREQREMARASAIYRQQMGLPPVDSPAVPATTDDGWGG